LHLDVDAPRLDPFERDRHHPSRHRALPLQARTKHELKNFAILDCA